MTSPETALFIGENFQIKLTIENSKDKNSPFKAAIEATHLGTGRKHQVTSFPAIQKVLKTACQPLKDEVLSEAYLDFPVSAGERWLLLKNLQKAATIHLAELEASLKTSYCEEPWQDANQEYALIPLSVLEPVLEYYEETALQSIPEFPEQERLFRNTQKLVQVYLKIADATGSSLTQVAKWRGVSL